MDDQFFMKQALAQAKIALSAGEFPVGCVIVYQDQIIASGARACSVGKRTNEIDHAELIALKKLAETEKPYNKKKTTLYCTMEPCLMCFGAILLSGIGRIVYAYEDIMGGGTNCDLLKLNPLYRNTGISIVPHILCGESLILFKEFFSNPENTYWKDSMLAKYTLNQ